MATASFYFLWQFPYEVKEIASVKKMLVEYQGHQNRFIDLFAQVKADPDLRLMVYIPKTENDFWKTSDGLYGRIPRLWDTQCACIPLYVPILTGRPSLYGLPDPVRECHPYHRGYEGYSEESYKVSGKKLYSHDELCTEVRKQGFHGYYRLTATAEKFLCD